MLPRIPAEDKDDFTSKPVSNVIGFWKDEASLRAALRGILGGGITGAIEIMITYPTEYVKTQLHLDGKGKDRMYKGNIDVVTKTIKAGGFLGLYRGLSVLLVGSIPKSAVRFGAYEKIHNFLAKDNTIELTPFKNMLCGLVAGSCEALLAVTPMETIKVKFIADQRSKNPQFKGLFHGVKTIIRLYGIKGVYRGVLATVLKQATNQATRFTIVEGFKGWYRKRHKLEVKEKLPTWYIGIAGMIAGITSVYVNNPFDVVKSRMQGLEADKYKNIVDCFRQTWNEGGFLAFYKGAIARVCRLSLDVSLTFMVYENINYLLQKII